MCPEGQTGADLSLVLGQQVRNELVTWITGDFLRRIEQTQSRRGNHRLLHRHMDIALSHVEVATGISLIAKGPCRQPRHAASMARRKGDLKAFRICIGKPMNAVGPEVVVFPLLAVGDYRRTGGLELLDRL